jgi:Na+-transporting methylmalonyl-CoA/oxaloacetate decarboxylase gamma subunit
MTKKILILFGVLFLLGLILGGWGMSAISSRAKQKAVEEAKQVAREECAAVKTERDALALHAKMTALRLRLGQVAIQAGKMNYGLARTEAESVFKDAEALERLVRGTADERALQMILARKDQLLGDLAVGSPAGSVALDQMYEASLEGAGSR